MPLVANYEAVRRNDMGRVVVVDSHPIMGEGLALLLRAEGIDAVYSPATETSSVVRSCDRERAGIVLLGLGLLAEDASLIGALLADRRVVVGVASGAHRAERLVALEAGAATVLDRDVTVEQVVDVVRRLGRGEPLPTRFNRDILLSSERTLPSGPDGLRRLATLTAQEAEVLRGLMAGLVAKELADEFVVSLATVRSQIASVLRKLDVRSQVAAVARGHEAGWRALSPSVEPPLLRRSA